MLASEKPKALSALLRGAPLRVRVPALLRPFFNPFDRLVREIPEGADLLDVGCGTGQFIAQLALNGKPGVCFGVDAKRRRVQAARNLARRLKGVDARFERARMPEDWPAGAFDAICMIDHLRHVQAAAQHSLFAAAVDRLKPGGILLVKEIDADAGLAARLAAAWEFGMSGVAPHLLPATRLRQWAQGAGLKFVRQGNWRALKVPHVMLVFRRES